MAEILGTITHPGHAVVIQTKRRFIPFASSNPRCFEVRWNGIPTEAEGAVGESQDVAILWARDANGGVHT